MAGPTSTCEASPGQLSGTEHTDSTDQADDSPKKSSTDMPARKNKRKLSEPRRRSDFSVKRLCPNSPGSVSDNSVSSEVSDRGHKEDPPDTPDTGFLLDHGDSQGGIGKSSASLAFSERVTCMVPNLYFPAGLGRSTEALGIPLSYDSAGPFHFDHGLRGKAEDRQRLHASYPSVDESEECQDEEGSPSERGGKRPRKNYKNMTRERRIEANARERTRVHTISAAFESLRRAVPSYSYNQKLSKLAILRIACTYIMALGRLADIDYSTDGNKMDFPECVDLCTRTIQTEGRARRRH
ncbi:uncharacterized protein LOC135461263 [Liolophura sinensis]|uniref:uncharacterized protein LOC135461263 n=1 Tax=Liolophura sinensis TaxID=3198878 RepID=UPI003158C2C2